MTRRIQFKADYNHRWPSRAMSHFRSNGGPNGDGIYTVKPEVAQAAVPKYATIVDQPATQSGDGKSARRESPGRMDGSDPGTDRDATRPDELEPNVRSGLGDGVPAADLGGK